MRTLRTLALVMGTLAALGAGARVSDAHIVPTGVGTQTWIDVRPRKIVVRFNLGFSSLLGLGELRKADADKSGSIDAAEEQAYLEALIRRVSPQLRLFVDGKLLEWTVLTHQAAGMKGPIDRVAFDTVFDLEAPVALGPGPHELSYEEGTYKEEVSQQILYVITSRAADFKDFFSETKTPGAPVMEQEGAVQYYGRDVSIKFELRAQTLERDRAEAILEPVMAGLQASIDSIAGQVARTAELDLRSFSCGAVSFQGARSTLPMSSPIGFKVPSAPMAGDRGVPAKSIFATEEDQETDEMRARAARPFGIVTILLFVVAGAVHAKGPGHGKSMVAAYLIGTKGRIWDAVRLGGIVTFTHTFTLYSFGLGLVYLVEKLKLTTLSQQAVQTRAIFLITLFSGIGLALYGLGLAWRRKKNLERAEAAKPSAPLAHTHVHEAPKPLAAPTGKRLMLAQAAPVEIPIPVHGHSHDSAHDSAHDGHSHSHDGAHGEHGHTHAHDGSMDEDAHAALHAREATAEISSWKDLLSLGISGGIVPCPAGILLIVFSLQMKEQNTLRCFVYLNAFSLGLGAVLVGIAVLMVISRNYLAAALTGKRARWLTVLPIYSAIGVALVGGSICYEAFDPEYKKAYARVSRIFTSDDATKTNRQPK